MTDYENSSNRVDRMGKSPKIELTAETAWSILINDLTQISYVGEWAKRVECTPCWLGKCLKVRYGVEAKEMLRTERYKRICSVIRENPQLRADQVADLVNRRWNGKHLSDFLQRNYQTNFTKLKTTLLAVRDEAERKLKSN